MSFIGTGTTLIVGEAYGETEEAWGAPFVGASGIELNEELEDAGFLQSGDAVRINKSLYAARNGTLRPSIAIATRDNIYRQRGLVLTNCANARPPNNKIEHWFLTKTQGRSTGDYPIHDRYPTSPLREGIDILERLISGTHPSLIIVLGGTPLWGLGGRDGITRWRGSQLRYVCRDGYQCPLVPTLHPAAVLREWPWRPVVVHDLKRAKHELDNGASHGASHGASPPKWDFTIRPTKSVALEYLNNLANGCPTEPLTADTETIGGHVTCIGFADSPRRAICIPFLDPERPDANYWSSVDEELDILNAIRRVLTRRPITFHNGLYDAQVILNDWGFMPLWTDDTMVAQHVAFPGFLGAGIDPVTGAASKKGSSLTLAFLASMYCEHYVFWKDDGRLWNPNTTPADQLWRYNCEDCARTFEVFTALKSILRDACLSDAYEFQCKRLGRATLRIMQRGIAIDRSLRREQLNGIHKSLDEISRWFEKVLDHPLNPQSNPQMKALFYDDLRCPMQYTGKGENRRLSCDDEALTVIRRERPDLGPLITRCQDYRTLAVLGGKAVAQNRGLLTCRLSDDNRFRFTLNLCGTETFRYSSGPNAFGEGCNAQNISKMKG